MNLFVDTSIWIDFFAGKKNQRIELLSDRLETGENLFSTPIIIQEVLQGCRKDSQADELALRLQGLTILSFELSDAIEAARTYRLLRRQGKTCGTIDIQIAALCARHHLTLLTSDKDFVPLAKVLNFKLF